MTTTKAILLCAAVAAGAAGCRKPAEGAAGSEPDARKWGDFNDQSRSGDEVAFRNNCRKALNAAGLAD